MIRNSNNNNDNTVKGHFHITIYRNIVYLVLCACNKQKHLKEGGNNDMPRCGKYFNPSLILRRGGRYLSIIPTYSEILIQLWSSIDCQLPFIHVHYNNIPTVIYLWWVRRHEWVMRTRATGVGKSKSTNNTCRNREWN